MEVMNLNDWLKDTGMKPYTLSKLARLSPTTITNILRGRPPVARTVKKLVRLSKDFRKPITFDMFPRVYLYGTYKIISGAELFKKLLEKKLEK